MQRISRLVVGGILGASVALIAAGTASAHDNGYGGAPNNYASNTHTTGSAVGNGSWYYGVHEMINGSDRNVDSSYYHSSKLHRASVQANDKVTRSADKSGGVWAQATRDAAASGNQSFWYVY